MIRSFCLPVSRIPHPRILVPPEILASYPEEQIPLPASLRDPLEGKPDFQTRGKFRIHPEVTDAEFRRVVAYYYALITHIDIQVGRILKALEEQKSAQQYDCRLHK